LIIQEKSVDCFDCGVTFVFTPEEQQAFQTKGYTHSPKRCPACRQNRKIRQINKVQTEKSFSGIQTFRQLFPVTCASCGKNTQVPFEPYDNRPVYCRECYQDIKASRSTVVASKTE
jgi:CxxC-x17-CxxC domain-containing protein